MFSNNSYAKIKSVENKGNYSVCKISISKKDKNTNKYDTDFIANVRFVGQAHLQKPMENQRIKITSCGVSNCYTKDEKLEFYKNPNYVIFAYELQDTNGEHTQTKSFSFELTETSEDLPF